MITAGIKEDQITWIVMEDVLSFDISSGIKTKLKLRP